MFVHAEAKKFVSRTTEHQMVRLSSTELVKPMRVRGRNREVRGPSRVAQCIVQRPMPQFGSSAVFFN